MQVRSHDSYTSPTNIVTLKGAETTVCNKSETEKVGILCAQNKLLTALYFILVII